MPSGSLNRSRRRFLKTGGYGLALAVAPVASCRQVADIPIVQEGAAVSRIVASKEAASLARILAEYLEKSTGAKVPIFFDVSAAGFSGVTIHIGRIAGADTSAMPANLDADGFIISAKANAVTICGPTPMGTEFGVYDFLERFVGVRWLLPGPDGEDVEQRKTLAIPEGTIVDQPEAFSRYMSGLASRAKGGIAHETWARRNRMHLRCAFHHNLANLFPPDVYTKSHPEFFPMLNGKTRLLPTTNAPVGWQPCFSAPGIVEEAVKNITRWFDEHPAVQYYSLGVNDGGNHCRCPECLPKVPAGRNYLGMDDYSDQYYAWCNRVIEGVLKAHPDKSFGCLGHNNVAGAPKNVKLHPRLMPFLAYDRMKWVHPEVRDASHLSHEAWQRQSRQLGWYDFLFGFLYCVPRVYFREAGQYLRYGRDHGVRAHYAELYPGFGEGPKAYLYLKLWWNADLDVDALLKDWYERCVGVEAAPHLERYYAIWERFWSQDILRSRWFTKGGQYLISPPLTYLADVKEADMRDSRRLLDECVAKCSTDKQRARAKALETAFQYYEATWYAYRAVNARPRVDTEAHALDTLNRAEHCLRMAAKRRSMDAGVFAKDPILMRGVGLEKWPELIGDTLDGNGLWVAQEWVTRGDNAVRRRIAQLAQEAEPGAVREQAQLMLAAAAGKLVQVSSNPSFEEGRAREATGWGPYVAPGNPPQASITRTAERAHGGSFSVVCDQIRLGVMGAIIKGLPPGRYCAMAWVYFEEDRSRRLSRSSNVSQDVMDRLNEQNDAKRVFELAVIPRDEGRNNLTGFGTKINPRPDEWILVVASGTIEAQVDGAKVAMVQLSPTIRGFHESGKLYLDDVALYRVGD